MSDSKFDSDSLVNRSRPDRSASEEPVLSVEDLEIRFGRNVAVAGVSFTLRPGEVLAVVGESGSGKSAMALALMGLHELTSSGRVTGGRIRVSLGAEGMRDLRELSEPQLRSVRGGLISMIFQEPLTALNPVHAVGDQIAEVLRVHRNLSRHDARMRAVELMRRVRVPDAGRRAREFPHQMSGGMRQRIMIAMALAGEPKILIADEPTTALDVTIQAQILALLRELKEELDAGVIFITHDMGVVAEIADRVLVMRDGVAVEMASVTDIFSRPQDPYTRLLLSAVPKLGSMRGQDDPAPFTLTTNEA